MILAALTLYDIKYCDYNTLTKLLPKERLDKIDSYKTESSKLESLASGLLLRHLLEQYGCKNYSFSYNKYGKPYIERGPHFSLTHSNKLVCCAVSDNNIGIDAEFISAARDNVARRSFSSEEYASYSTASDHTSEFYRLWTRKEAYLKYIGTGLASPMYKFNTLSPDIDSMLQSIRLHNYWLSICIKEKAGPILQFLNFSDIITEY